MISRPLTGETYTISGARHHDFESLDWGGVYDFRVFVIVFQRRLLTRVVYTISKESLADWCSF